MDKATKVFQKISKCKKPKKMMEKKAIGPMGVAVAAQIGLGFLPKTRNTITTVTDAVGKGVKMKNQIKLPRR